MLAVRHVRNVTVYSRQLSFVKSLRYMLASFMADESLRFRHVYQIQDIALLAAADYHVLGHHVSIEEIVVVEILKALEELDAYLRDSIDAKFSARKIAQLA